jgi:serine/threonine protein phosphatase PrpC
MSRALGDLQYKNPLNKVDRGPAAGEGDLEAASAPSEQRGDFLSSKPHLARITLEKDRRYILTLVTDGVLDAVEEDVLMRRICGLSSQQGLEAEEISWRVVNEVGDMPKSDNATCVTVFLDGCKLQLR